MPEPRSGWYDDFGGFHDANPPDMGYSGVHEHRPPELPPHLRPPQQRPAREPVPKAIAAAFEPRHDDARAQSEMSPTGDINEAAPEPVDALEPSSGPRSAEERAVRGLMSLLRSLLPHEDQEP